MGLDDPVRRAPKLLGQQAQEHVLHARVLALEEREVVAEDRARLAVLERGHGRRPTRAREQERELPERLPRTEHVEEDAVSDGRLHPRGEAATNDEVQRLGRIVAMEDDLSSPESASAGDRHELPNVSRREIGEQRPLHGTESRAWQTALQPLADRPKARSHGPPSRRRAARL